MKNKLNELYMSYDKVKDEFIFNDLLPKLELFNAKIQKIIYNDGLSIAKAYDEVGCMRTRVNWEQFSLENVLKPTKKEKMPFKEACEKYFELNTGFVLSNESEELMKLYPILSKCHVLGLDVCKSLRFVQKDIENAYINKDVYKSKDMKVFKMLKSELGNGDFVTKVRVKELIQKYYDKVGIEKKAKATDINNYFETKRATKTIKDKRVEGITIIRSKIIFE